MIVIAVALVIFWPAGHRPAASVNARPRPHDPRIAKTPPAIPVEPSPQPSPAGETPDSPATVVPEVEFPAIEVQEIFSESDNPTARLNGTVVGQGDEIAGAKVVEIGGTSVTLSFRGVTKSFSVQ